MGTLSIQTLSHSDMRVHTEQTTHCNQNYSSFTTRLGLLRSQSGNQAATGWVGWVEGDRRSRGSKVMQLLQWFRPKMMSLPSSKTRSRARQFRAKNEPQQV